MHSYYNRKPADLPVSGGKVNLEIGVRRFRCLNPVCARRTFSEVLPGFLDSRARRTNRLKRIHSAVGSALGGEAGARLLPKIFMPVSADTLLRDVRQEELPVMNPPRCVGVDDWAIRRGRTYSTILVDLERHTVIDVLPDRTSASLAAWLREHPGTLVITRDRSTEYAKGVREGAPEAMQVC